MDSGYDGNAKKIRNQNQLKLYSMNIKDAKIGMKVRVILDFESLYVSKSPERNLGVIVGTVLGCGDYEIKVNIDRLSADEDHLPGTTLWWFPASHLEPYFDRYDFVEPLEKDVFSAKSLIKKFFNK
jgi:hypothetical protein